MEMFSILGLNLPFSVVIILLFSYFIWCKFFNFNLLRIRNVNHLFDILSIFTFLMTLLFSLVTFWLAISGVFNLNFNIQRIVDQVPKIVTFLSLFGIWYFITSYRNKWPSENDLKKIFISCIQVFAVLVSFFIGAIILILISSLRYALINVVFLFASSIFLILFSYATISESLFEINFKEEVLNRVLYISSLLVFFMVIFFGFLTIPHVSYGDQAFGEYHVHSASSRSGVAFLRTTVPIEIKTFGFIDYSISVLPIDYDSYNLETSGFGGEQFSIRLNTSESDGYEMFISSFNELEEFEDVKPTYGFTNVFLNKKEGIINFKFDRDRIKEFMPKNMLLEGYIKKNITELDYTYNDNGNGRNTCNTFGCTLVFNLSNNLDFPVDHESDQIIDLYDTGVKNVSNCIFTNISTNFPRLGIFDSMKSSCNENRCVLNIRETTSNDQFADMRLSLREGKVDLNLLEMERPITFDAKFVIDCS